MTDTPAPQPTPAPAPSAVAAPVASARPTQSERNESARQAHHARSRAVTPRPGDRVIDYTPRSSREAAADIAPADTPGHPAKPDQAERIKLGEVELTAGEWQALAADKAQRDLRAATLPADPAGYQVKLPDDFQPPGGYEFRIDEAAPQNRASFDALKTWAHVNQIDQGAFSSLVGLYAGHVAGEQAMIAERARQEMEALGANAAQRLDAVSRWLTATLGSDKARPLIATAVTKHHIEFFESMMQKLSAQGVGGFSQRHRDHGNPREIDGWNGMTYEQRRHAQETMGRR